MKRFSSQAPEAKRPFLVFTSAGDHSSIQHWLKGQKDFDLWIAFYGDKPCPYKQKADFFVKRKDGKFPNLYALFQQYKNVMSRYEAIAVLDDDLILSGTDISNLFAVRRAYDFWLLQPAFLDTGKISHPITRAQAQYLFRCTNFVEENSPFFKTEHLLNFLQVYDPILKGFGIDWWYLHHLHPPRKKVAIIDAIPCVNPEDDTKAQGRELALLQSEQERRAVWNKIQKRLQIKEGHFEVYGGLPVDSVGTWLDWVKTHKV